MKKIRLSSLLQPTYKRLRLRGRSTATLQALLLPEVRPSAHVPPTNTQLAGARVVCCTAPAHSGSDGAPTTQATDFCAAGFTLSATYHRYTAPARLPYGSLSRGF